MNKDLVSIIMLSKDNGQYIKDTIESVLAQTYQNWELIFMDDSSEDDTITQMMEVMDEDILRQKTAGMKPVSRIHVSKNVDARGDGLSTNSALSQAKGRWIAFLNVGDVWEPEKLERQIAFMEEHGYAFSYTKFGLMNLDSKDKGIVIGGRDHITYKDMQKCCWPTYLTVMYDAGKVGKMRVRSLKRNNDYALWLNVCEKVDCHLLPENLARIRTKRNLLGKFLLTNKLKWRYECYRIEEDLNPFKASLYTIRNGFYSMVKWLKYVERA